MAPELNEAVIVEAVRTPVGKREGALKDRHPVDLLGETLAELVARSGVDASRVDDVICGCVSQIGEQSINVGRNASLAAGLPEDVPAGADDPPCGGFDKGPRLPPPGVAARG